MTGALLLIGILVWLLGWGMIVIAAFKESAGWGIGSLLFWPVAVVFAVMHWSEAKQGFLVCVTGPALIVLSIAVTVVSAPDQAKLKPPAPKSPVSAPETP